MPGTAHGRASVSGSRRYGWNGPSPRVALSTPISGRLARSGIFHGSEPVARNASDRNATGVMYFSAMRQASMARSKHSPGVAGATIGMGESELRPNMTWSRSACSFLVGMPVEGPARWTSMTTSGSSTMTARPIASVLSAMPGPDDAVMPSAPP